jgi:glycosyltransferase involved in cell wall biosynthesis
VGTDCARDGRDLSRVLGVIDVAIDARVTRRMSYGVRAYVHELLTRLPAVAPDLSVAALGSGENFGLAEQVGLPRAIVRSGAKIVHFPTTFAPLLRSRPYVLTIHDLIHLRYAALFGRPTAWHYRVVGIPLARGAARLVVGDERTVRDCETYLGVRRERCRVVPLGYDPGLLDEAPPFVAERPFLLYAGNHKPHKNLATLYAAWAAIAARRAIDLRITGAPDPALDVSANGARGRLIFTGHLSSTDLHRHYRAALAYVHPALAEGFGIPMLEAGVVGTPVIASAGAIPSIVKPFASTFEARSVRELTGILDHLVRDPAPFTARAAEGASVLRAYTWDRFAAGTAAVYREVIQCS